MSEPKEIYKIAVDATNSNNTLNIQWNKPATFIKAIPPTMETWDDIWLRFMESEEYVECANDEVFKVYIKWLETNYKAPERKIVNF